MESGGGKGVGVWGERKIVSKHKPVALECLSGWKIQGGFCQGARCNITMWMREAYKNLYDARRDI